MNLDPRQRHYVETITESGGQLLDIINDILDVAKIEAGQMELDAVPFDTHDLARSVVELHGGRPDAAGLSVRVVITDRVPEVLIGDPLRLRQVLGNLVSNAVKFTSAGEVVLRVDLVADTPNQATVRCAVHDTGPGIAREDQHDLFEEFTQVDGSNSRAHGGTGLGLAICRQLVKLMGGTIAVDSTPGEGSCFSITVPFTRAPVEALASQ